MSQKEFMPKKNNQLVFSDALSSFSRWVTALANINLKKTT